MSNPDSDSPHPRSDEPLLESVVVEWGPPSPSPDLTVVWLHGLGADGHDFEPIVPHLQLPEDRSVRFVFPHASTRPVTLNGGMVMRAWYDILGLESSRDHDEAGIEDSARAIEALLTAELARGTPSQRLVLAGFSQGGAMAAHVGLRCEHTLAGILILSAYLLFPDRLAAEASAANRETPIFQAHGLLDPVVQLSWGERSSEHLRALGYSVEWKTYPVAHAVDLAEILEVGRWLRDRLPPPGS